MCAITHPDTVECPACPQWLNGDMQLSQYTAFICMRWIARPSCSRSVGCIWPCNSMLLPAALQGAPTTFRLWQLPIVALNHLLAHQPNPTRACLQPAVPAAWPSPSSQLPWPVNTLIMQRTYSLSIKQPCRHTDRSTSSSSSHQTRGGLLPASGRLLSRAFSTSESTSGAKQPADSGSSRPPVTSRPSDELLQRIKATLTYMELEELLEDHIPRLTATHLAAAATQAARLHAQHLHQQQQQQQHQGRPSPQTVVQCTASSSSSAGRLSSSRGGVNQGPPGMRQVAVAATRQRQLTRLMRLLERMCVVAGRRLDLGPFAHLLFTAVKTGHPVSAELQQAVAGLLLHAAIPMTPPPAPAGARTAAGAGATGAGAGATGAGAGAASTAAAASPAQQDMPCPDPHDPQQEQEQDKEQHQHLPIRPLTGRAGLPPALLSARGHEVTMAALAWSQVEGAAPQVLQLLLEAALQKLPQLSLVSMAQLLTAAQRAGLASPLVLRRVTRQALALRPWDNPRHLLYLLGGLQRLEQELGQAPDVQLWTAAGEALRSAREQLTAEQQLQAERLLAVAQEMAPDVAAAMATSRAGPAQDVAT